MNIKTIINQILETGNVDTNIKTDILIEKYLNESAYHDCFRETMKQFNIKSVKDLGSKKSLFFQKVKSNCSNKK